LPREQSVESFNARATRYDESVLAESFHRPVQQATLAVAAALVPEPRAVLDVGCGTGSLLRMLAVRFPRARLTGVDPAERMVAVAIAALAGSPHVRVARAPAERLPFPDAEFDLVVSTNSFHHWSNQQAGLRDVGRVLEPGGCLVLADPFAVGRWLRAWSALLRKRDRLRTPPEMDAMLRAARMEPLDWDPVFRTGPLPIVHAVSARREDG
jgi:ubiquinone/menaquinone biosynthesis C-methylase UbiE